LETNRVKKITRSKKQKPKKEEPEKIQKEAKRYYSVELTTEHIKLHRIKNVKKSKAQSNQKYIRAN
jgi:hypothetical protein